MTAELSIAVVIPTIGRESLIASIESVLKQTIPPEEIIIIGLLSDELLAKVNAINPGNIRIVNETSGNIAIRRNIGISQSKSEYLAFLDDDDEWYPQKLESQLQYLPIDVISCRANFVGWRPGIRPHKLVTRNILETIYSEGFLRINNYGVYTPTLLVRKSLALNVMFDPELSEFEDLWFLANLEKAGASFVQIPEVLVQINSKKPLENRDIDVGQYLNWYLRIKTFDVKSANRYILGIALRNLVYRKKFKTILQLLLALIPKKDRIKE